MIMPIKNSAPAFLLALLALALSGCVSLPPVQNYNRETHADIKTITVMPMATNEPQILMMNNPGNQFGLIGGLIAASDHASKLKKLREDLHAAGFDAVALFKSGFTEAMAKRGFILIWPDPISDDGKVKRDRGLRSTYAAVTNSDAALDINMLFTGYSAAGASKNAPYRPTMELAARLVSADGKQNYFTDRFIYNNVKNINGAIVVTPDERYAYPTFKELDVAGPQAAEGLTIAVRAVADKLAEQF